MFDKDTLLDTLCGWILQPRLIAKDDMTIIFHTDDSVYLSGFKAEYSIRVPEGRLELTKRYSYEGNKEWSNMILPIQKPFKPWDNFS